MNVNTINLKEKSIKLLLLIFFGGMYILPIIATLPFTMGNYVNIIYDIIKLVAIGSVLLFCHKELFQVKNVVFYILVLTILVLNYLVHKDLRSIVNKNITFLLYALTGYGIASLVKTDEIIKKIFTIVGIFGLVCCVYLKIQTEKAQDYMSFGYRLLLPSIIFLDRALRKKRSIYFVLAGICSVMIVLYGSRGALLCNIAYFFMYQIYFRKPLSRKGFDKFIFFISFISVIILLLLVSGAFKSLILRMNGTSRTLDLLLSSNISSTTGRDGIFFQFMRLIPDIPLYGEGLFSDRDLFRIKNYNIFHAHSHNIIMEIIMNFGVIVGLFISIYLGFSTVKALSDKNNQLRETTLILFCFVIIKLFISSSYLQEPTFFFFIGLLSYKSNKRFVVGNMSKKCCEVRSV